MNRPLSGAPRPAPVPVATASEPSDEPSDDGVAPRSRPGGRTALRRRLRPAKQEGGGLSAMHLRIAVIAVLIVGGAAFKALNAVGSGNAKYWNAAAELDRQIQLDPNRDVNLENIRKKFAALPISGATDPKLFEFHQLSLDIVDLSIRIQAAGEQPKEADLVSLKAKLDRYRPLLDELNMKYVGRK